MSTFLQETVNLVTTSEEIVVGKLHFWCDVQFFYGAFIISPEHWWSSIFSIFFFKTLIAFLKVSVYL